MSEIYHSSTLGLIKLSFTGRRLMQNLREEFKQLLQIAYKNGVVDARRSSHLNPNQIRRSDPVDSTAWAPLSRARGELVKHMSTLEGYRAFLSYDADKDKGSIEPVRTASPQRPLVLQLPPVPDGYMLEAVGNIVIMRPIKKKRVVKHGTAKRKRPRRP